MYCYLCEKNNRVHCNQKICQASSFNLVGIKGNYNDLMLVSILFLSPFIFTIRIFIMSKFIYPSIPCGNLPKGG